MLEVEMKFPVADFTALERQLIEAGAEEVSCRQEEDHYFNTPVRDFSRTDEALRLRRIGSANLVTYKGPKRDAQTKTRTEIEVPLADGPDVAEKFAQILTLLGFRVVGVVQKQRRIYQLEREGFHVEVCLDEVIDLGRFVELEIQAPEDLLPQARNAILRFAEFLGLQQGERRSYLEMLLKKQNRSPLSPWGRGAGGEG